VRLADERPQGFGLAQAAQTRGWKVHASSLPGV
jgi:hypothetical protein